MEWTLFAQLVGGLGFPIVAIAIFAWWYSKQEEKRRLDYKEDREKQRQDDIKRDAEYREDCKEREEKLLKAVNDTNELNKNLSNTNEKVTAINERLVEHLTKDVSKLKEDVGEIKTMLITK